MNSLNDFKELKKAKIIYADLLEIKEKLNNCIESLRSHGKYVLVMESLSVLHNSRTLLDIKLDKAKLKLEKND